MPERIESLDPDELFEELNSPFGKLLVQHLKEDKQETIEEISELDFAGDENARFKAVGLQGGIRKIEGLFDFIDSLKKQESDLGGEE